MVFGDEIWSIELVVRRIHHSHDEFLSFCVKHPKHGSFLTVRWQPPPEGSLKLNVDGSFMPAISSMGTGGVLRNHQGNWVAGFSTFEGKGDILQAELLAVKNGLTLAWQLGFRKIHCETDCLEAIQLV